MLSNFLSCGRLIEYDHVDVDEFEDLAKMQQTTILLATVFSMIFQVSKLLGYPSPGATTTRMPLVFSPLCTPLYELGIISSKPRSF